MRWLAALCTVVLLLCCGAPAAASGSDEHGLASREHSELAARMAAAGASVATAARHPGRDLDTTAPWAWPLPSHRVVKEFDPPRSRWGAGHRGIDVLGALGSPVTAVADGVVSYSGVIAGVGVVSVRHEDGLRSTYQPVDDRARPGTRVRRGDPIGTLAPGGHCLLLTCLHLGALRGRDLYVDPMTLLRGWRLALLTLD